MARVSVGPTTAYADVSGSTFFSDAVTAVANIKTGRGLIYLLDLMNGAAATSYLQVFFQPASKVTLGTTAPDLVIKLPTNAGSGFTKTVSFPIPVGATIQTGGSLGSTTTGPGTGLSVAGTTTATGASTAAIGVTAVFY
jgi:hypothetical protein